MHLLGSLNTIYIICLKMGEVMDYNKIIYLLAVVFVVLLITCFAVFTMTFAKKDAVINVTSENALYDGDYFSISLTDVNGNPLANQVVDITIIDANGGENHQQVTTDESGNGMLQLNGLTAGNYNVIVVYGGNEDYSPANMTQGLEIKKVEEIAPEPYVVSMSYDRCVLYWSDGHTTYRGETGNPITKEEYEHMKIYGKK